VIDYHRRAQKNRVWRQRHRLRHWLANFRHSGLAAACGISLAVGLWYGGPGALALARSHSYFALNKIEVDGNLRLSRAELLQWAGLDEHTSVWDAPPDLVRLRLQSHPWIRRASVHREFPNRLAMSVEERRPVAIVRLQELHYVDRGGRILGALRQGDSPDFPLITGLESSALSDFVPVGVHRALRFLRLCERTSSCFDAVSEVRVDRDRGLTVFPLRTSLAVVLGWGSWREKLARSARVLATLEGQVGRLAAVDVSFRNLVVVKLRDEPRPAVARNKKGVRV